MKVVGDIGNPLVTLLQGIPDFNSAEFNREALMRNLPILARDAAVQAPGKTILTKLIGFYKITEEEIKNCREAPRRKLSVSTSLGFNHSHGKRITVLLESLAHVIRDVTAMQSHGLLATRLRLDCLDNLDKAQLLLQDAVIIERLI